ncbi:Acg family FMN-binding oxidoreductase [Cryptosporangium sp. NPDC048952]|uniref:Acg family FMN-binding oxidoreductase n=1 Tax=Cryptosporangium sp. NPDC048952 TaxID=3363961 RepID=UPI003713B2BB
MADRPNYEATADDDPRAADRRADLDLLTEATLAARRAPSILNTQPWVWQLRGNAAELWLDRDRHLPGLDPDGRLALLSCGAALHHALTTLRAQRYAGIVERLGDRRLPDLIARVRCGTACTPDYALSRAIYARRTDRRPFADQPLGAEDFDALQTVAHRHQVSLTILTSVQEAEFARIVAAADAVEHASRPMVRDLRAWTTRPVESGDGISSRSVTEGGDRAIAPRVFDPRQRPGLPLGPGTEGGTRHAVLTTREDQQLDWLTAGEALSDVWLTLTSRGLAASPLSEVIETRPAREALRDLLRTDRFPAIALRVGCPADLGRAVPASARRPESDVLRLPGGP